MSDRIILIRIQGLGSLLTDAQLVLTSRGTLPYLDPAATLAGVISDLGDQFSSEIGFFESMGSDPSTSFSVVSTAETRAALLGRRKVAILDESEAPVVTTTYVPPLFTDFQIGVSSTQRMFEDQRIRIGTIALVVREVMGANLIKCSRIWGSPRTPIPMILAGEEAVGMVVYDATLSTGNVEGLPIVVSTAEVTATSRSEEEVIFRGVVTKVGVETSRGAANQITVQCGSLMGYLRNAPFRPPIATTTTLSATTNAFDANLLGTTAGHQIGSLTVTTNVGVYGVPTWNDTFSPEPTPTATSMRAWQIRDGGRGAALPYAVNYNAFPITVDGQIARMQFSGWGDYTRDGDRLGSNWLTIFDSSFYSPYGGSPLTESMVTFAIPYNDRQAGQLYNVTSTSESAFVCGPNQTPETMILDLIFGTVDGLLSGASGWRSATEAAWIPYAYDEQTLDVVDVPSLTALLQGRDDVFPPESGLQNLRVLPYDAGSAKTVGDVLGLILKRLGGFMVYDQGKLRFGSWAVNNPIPTVVDDSALAEPAISLDFDRNACLQAVEVEVGVFRWRNESASDPRRTIKRPVTNLDLGAAGIGKTAQMGCFEAWAEGSDVVNRWITGSSWFATANQAVVRYSQPAARVVVTYRDAVSDLVVGETVAFSTAYLPSATGEMGIALATGIVLKAARSWKTPSTEYSLLLFGYVGASASKVPLIGASALCTGVVTGNDVEVEAVWFTRGSSATGGAPTSDVAAFGQTAILAGNDFVIVALLDANGTEVGGGPDLATPRPLTNELRFTGPPFLGTPILPGYVITLANAASGLQGWDAFQAGADGTISHRPEDAFPWVT